jgi:thiamine biosynthesis lipoprotein
MGTTATIRIQALDPEPILAAGRAVINQLEGVFSRFRPDSEVSALNRSAGTWVTVGHDTDALLREASHLARRTGGAYDPVLGALTALWDIGGFRRGAARAPDQSEVERARALCGHGQLRQRNERQYLLPPGALVDLGGIAKGYTADQVRDFSRSLGASSAVVSLGSSSIAVLGPRFDGGPWRIGLRAVRGGADEGLGWVELSSGALSTSGDYEQGLVAAGQRLHHILDPATGWPARSPLRAATVLAASGTLAEAYSTAFLVTGPDGAWRHYVRHHDFEAVLTTDDALLATPGLRTSLHLRAARDVPPAPRERPGSRTTPPAVTGR